MQFGSVQSAASDKGTAAEFTLQGIFNVFPNLSLGGHSKSEHDVMAFFSLTSWTRPVALLGNEAAEATASIEIMDVAQYYVLQKCIDIY